MEPREELDATTLQTIFFYDHRASRVVLMEETEDMNKEAYLEIVKRARVQKFGEEEESKDP